MSNMAVELTRAAATVAALGGSCAEFAGLSEAEVLAARGSIADLLRLSNTAAALLAGTIAQRSRPELGQSGLAARHGFGNPTLMVQEATGLSRVEAGRLVAVGVLMGDTETAERRAADVARDVERTARAAEEAAAEAAREAERAAVWAVLHPDLPPLPVFVSRPVLPIEPIIAPVPVVAPWQAPIVHAVTAGTFSPGVGDALLRGLGTLDQAITAEKLAAALRVLLVEASGMNTEQAYKRARRMRDDLDAAGILAREKQARDDTTWSLWRRADGMVTLHALFPPEQGERWMATYDALTSPRRGGVRFVDPERAAWAQSVKDDPRTLDQIAADSFTQLLKLGADADPNTLFGGRRPVVQVIVTEHDRPTTLPAPFSFPTPSDDPSTPAPETATDEGLQAAETVESGEPDGLTGTNRKAPSNGQTGRELSRMTGEPTNRLTGDLAGGRMVERMGGPTTAVTTDATPNSSFKYIEGNPAPVSAETIDRHLCDSGYLGILFDQTGQPLNVGRDQRLFNREQRRALAVRDGGCRWPGCDKPPAWTETHHIENWIDQGLSDIDHAILLCSLHHMLLHNRHWKIWFSDSLYWLQPPIEIDPERTLIALPSKNPLVNKSFHPDPPTSTRIVPGTVDSHEPRNGDLDRLDGNDPTPGHPYRDYHN
ncbi:HNH endonuclease signature motif containing protein [Cryobacterium sp. Y50]|uniref:HNH endonuclease signature motif containing protein n=1 Tax=Cryobacterium sp. Y50 TaxID=2048286 RepID=UPI000CE4CC0E|nr:HNH endonuclease signature motif containing protein [Cryobacterium sp. Y50]